MAADSAARDPVKDLCEEATCSICLEYFKDPVSLECRHNFCRDCVTQCWEKSGTTETFCPQCKERVLQSNLRPNPSLANIVKIAKELSLQGPRRAEGRERVCEKHQEPLNVFCEDDGTFICVVCDRSKELRDNRKIPLGPAARDYKVDLASSAAKDPTGYEITCSVCLEYFKDPVTLECGHNFCQSCVTQYWEKSDTQETSCPQCREKVQQRNLKSNWYLANIIEITKKRPQGQKRAEDQERVCGKHQEPLKLFCKDDGTPICCVCDRSKEHKDHTVIPVEEAAQEYKELMSVRQDILEKEKEKNLIYKAETNKEAQALLKQIEEKMEKTLEESTQVRQFLEEQEKHIQVQMEELKKQITRKRDEHLVLLSRKVSSLESLIQKMKEKCQHPPVELLQDVGSILQRSEEKKIFEKRVAFLPKLKWKVWEFCDLNSGLSAVMKQFRGTLLPKLELQKANVSLDPDTACSYLVVSEDHQRVRWEAKNQDVPDNPERFNPRAYVLGHEGFTKGRHFWEVVVETEGGWSVGVAKKSVRRKGRVTVSPKEGIWALGNWAGSYRAIIHPSNSALSLTGKIKRVRVCLNCDVNQLAFYNADTGDQIYKLSNVPFIGETVVPFFNVGRGGQLKVSL
ncbi:E3 ubiquitin-protein ligase TRIM7 [Anolis carolinensis]|uniref:E3 ubiquitin-protein ligase TRIM7 n=1 Tax=Anolis carolinensis TaxID=28377 RepID=UPI0004628F10|nr:PREDICTED: tripartite motif-containing protein 7 [Anolis carolinensis]|eukprot:XP_008103861.1 PREDICTED: tripartite motif-containing protein 7 [Anolis carolinensis]